MPLVLVLPVLLVHLLFCIEELELVLVLLVLGLALRRVRQWLRRAVKALVLAPLVLLVPLVLLEHQMAMEMVMDQVLRRNLARQTFREMAQDLLVPQAHQAPQGKVQEKVIPQEHRMVMEMERQGKEQELALDRGQARAQSHRCPYQSDRRIPSYCNWALRSQSCTCRSLPHSNHSCNLLGGTATFPGTQAQEGEQDNTAL